MTPCLSPTLHEQPEASIDILGAPYANQLEKSTSIITYCSGFGYDIWVKEHRSAIGDHWPSWYKDLSRIPGVRLISPDADGFEILQKENKFNCVAIRHGLALKQVFWAEVPLVLHMMAHGTGFENFCFVSLTLHRLPNLKCY